MDDAFIVPLLVLTFIALIIGGACILLYYAAFAVGCASVVFFAFIGASRQRKQVKNLKAFSAFSTNHKRYLAACNLLAAISFAFACTLLVVFMAWGIQQKMSHELVDNQLLLWIGLAIWLVLAALVLVNARLHTILLKRIKSELPTYQLPKSAYIWPHLTWAFPLHSFCIGTVAYIVTYLIRTFVFHR